jgi:tetratricopeptide (TPR) repeat protein
MTSKIFTPLFIGGLLFLTAGCATLSSPSKPYIAQEGPRPWYSFRSPAKKAPAEQLAHAVSLKESDQPRRAGRQFRALVASWPSSPEAAEAQHLYARSLDRRGKTRKAFDAYQELIEKYGGTFPFDEVSSRQFELAENRFQGRSLRWLLGGMRSPERAIPMLEKIVANLPGSDRAAQAQMMIGRAHEFNGDFDDAVHAYTQLMISHPNHELTSEAAYRRAFGLNRLTRSYPNDRRLTEDAWQAVSLFLLAHPDSPYRQHAARMEKELYNRRAKFAFDQVLFYERMRLAPAPLLEEYRLFAQRFPVSDYTAQAQRRILELSTKTGDSP